nr:MAG TPA: hypothetical protein [Caudoviricetes sp.]
MKKTVKAFIQNGYKVNDIFSMKLKDIALLNDMMESEMETELTEDFLDLLM